jgi:hypothetical protein
MKHRTGILPKDYKQLSKMKMNSEDLKELARTILAAVVMVIAISFCFLAAATAPEPKAREQATEKGGGWLAGPQPVTARRQSNP